MDNALLTSPLNQLTTSFSHDYILYSKNLVSSRGIIWSISFAFTAEKKRTQTSSLPPGHHVFQFSFKIPPYSLPSSFESKHGYVRYWLKARIHRPWRFDEVTKELVKILSLIDVNCPRVLVSSEIEIGVRKKLLFHIKSNFNNSHEVIFSRSLENQIIPVMVSLPGPRCSKTG